MGDHGQLGRRGQDWSRFEISVHLLKGGITVAGSDNGRGIPIDKRSALETVLTVLHAGWLWFGFPMRKIRRRQTMPVFIPSTINNSYQPSTTTNSRWTALEPPSSTCFRNHWWQSSNERDGASVDVGITTKSASRRCRCDRNRRVKWWYKPLACVCMGTRFAYIFGSSNEIW